MTMDVSRLAIEVESKGIQEASNALMGRNGRGGLTLAAEKAEKAVNTLTGSMSKLMSLNATASTQAWAQSLGQLNSTLQTISNTASATLNSMQAMVGGMNQMAAASNNATRANNTYVGSSHVMMNTLKALTTVGAVYAGINFAKGLIEAADSYQQLDARLKNVTGSNRSAKAAMQDLYDISQKVRTPIKDTSTIMVRLFDAMGAMGKTGKDVAEVTESIATGMKLWGSTGAETASAMLQLSQAFNKGKLDGAEFNAVAENGKPLLKAIAKEMGVGTEALFKLRSEGKITGDVMVKAFQNMLPEWRKQMEQMPVTFDDAIERIKNRWTVAVGEMGMDTGFNKELSNSLKVVEDMIPMVARGLADAFINVMKWVRENKDTLGQIWDQLIGLAKDVWNVGKMFVSWLGAITGAGEEFSLVASAIFGVRAVLAIIVDIVKGLGSAFVHVGLDIAQVVLFPIQLVWKTLQSIIEDFSEFYALAARGASALGLDTLAAGLGAVSQGLKSGADLYKGLNESIDSFISKGRNMADGWTKDLREGNGELDKLLNSTKELQQVQKKTNPGYDPLRDGPPPPPGRDEKAAKAAEKELKRFEDAQEALKAMLKQQIELNERLGEYGLQYDKLGPAQKKLIELEEHHNRMLRTGANEIELKHNKQLQAIAFEAAEMEKANERRLEALRIEEALLSKQKSKNQTLTEEANALEAKVAAYGKAKGEIEKIEEATTRARIAELSVRPEESRTAQQNEMLKLLGEELVARERIHVAAEKLGQLETQAEFDKLFDPKKAEKFGDVLANGFGKAGAALGKLMNAFDKYEARMSKVSKAWQIVEKETDPIKRARMVEKASELETESRVSSYADMAGAAKDFFDEGSRGYKTMEAVEKGYRAWQIAMQLKSFLQEIGLIQAVTTAKVAGDEVAATSATASAATQAQAAMVAGQANAIAGVANQANGDPYSAFFRMAAMAAVMAALGFAVGGIGGGGGKSLSASRQERQGTGTVLGDDKAKSESLVNATEMLADNSDIALRYSSEMLRSLQNIEASLTGVVNGIIRNGGEITGKGFDGSSVAGPMTAIKNGLKGILTGGLSPLMDGLASTFKASLGIGTSSKLVDSGITSGGQSIGDILTNGFQGSSYQDIEKTKKLLWMTTGKKTVRDTDALDPAINAEFTNVIESMVGTISSAAEALGFSAGDIEAKLKAVNISLGDISLKGLSAEEIQAELEAVFSAFGDQLATAALGDTLIDFQKAGEGLLETAVRVASGVELADYELEKLGLTAIEFTDIINKNGDVGSEIVRQTIMLEEQGTGIGEIINTMSGSAGDLAATYSDLLDVRSSLQALDIADDVTRELIRAAGGLEAMQDALESYTSNFFSDSERNAMKLSKLTGEFDKLGLQMPQTKEGFRELVEQLSASGPAGQETAMKLLLLSEAFADLADSSEALVEDARSNLVDAYERESQALIDVKDRFNEFAKSLSDFKNELITGDLSTLSPLEKYNTAKGRFDDVAARAAAGDESAMAEFQSVATEFLNISREVYASGAQYTQDFNNVLMQTTALEEEARGKATNAELQLEALNLQVDGLIEINESVLTVAEAIAELQAVMAAGLGVDIDGSHASGLSYVPFDGYVAELHKGEAILTASENSAYQSDMIQNSSSNAILVDEVRAMRQKLEDIRQGQREQTGQIITSNYEAQMRNADVVVEGQKDAALTKHYVERSKVSLV